MPGLELRSSCVGAMPAAAPAGATEAGAACATGAGAYAGTATCCTALRAYFAGDLDAIAVRWPVWHARVAHFLMNDPLRAAREQLQTRLATLGPAEAQGDLFAWNA